MPRELRGRGRCCLGPQSSSEATKMYLYLLQVTQRKPRERNGVQGGQSCLQADFCRNAQLPSTTAVRKLEEGLSLGKPCSAGGEH